MIFILNQEYDIVKLTVNINVFLTNFNVFFYF